MNNTPDHEHDFGGDDKVEITDLPPRGLPEHRCTQRAIALLLKGLSTPWMRASLGASLILILLGALIFQSASSAAQPSPGAIATPQAEARSPTFTAADGRVFVQSARNLLSALQVANGQELWRKQLPGMATLTAAGPVLYCY